MKASIGREGGQNGNVARTPRRRRVVAAAGAAAVVAGVVAGCSVDKAGQAVGFAPDSRDQNAWVSQTGYVYNVTGTGSEQVFHVFGCGPGGQITDLANFKHESAQSLKYGSLINPGHCIGEVPRSQITNLPDGSAGVGVVLGKPNGGDHFVAHPDIKVPVYSTIDTGIVGSKPFTPTADMLKELQGFSYNSNHSGATLIGSIEQATGIDTDKYPPSILAHQIVGFYILTGADVKRDDIADPTDYLKATVADSFRKPGVAGEVIDNGVLQVADPTLLASNMDQIVITYEKTAGLQ